MDTDLSFTDIRFLRKVRDINSNPEAYERTEKGKVPASTGAILKASNLSESEVRYRMGGSRCRGLEEAGLTIVHEAEFDEETKTFGAKSVELSQAGIDVLTEFEEEDELFDEDEAEDVPEVVKQLRGRVDKLEREGVGGGSGSVDVDREIRSLRNDIERLEQKIDSIQEDPWGAVDTEVVSHTKETIQRGQAMFYIFQSVFGIDVGRRVEDGEYPSASAVEAERVDVFEQLSSAGYSEDEVGSIQGENQSRVGDQGGNPTRGQESESVGGGQDNSEGDSEGEIESETSGSGEGDGGSPSKQDPPSFSDLG